MEEDKDRFLPFIVGAGNGFLIGHGFAVFGSAFHALNNAPHGQKINDFLTRLPSGLSISINSPCPLLPETVW